MTREDAIFQWKMTQAEAEAFRLCVVWEEQVKKLFPGAKTAKMPLKSDPRKCNLFRHCWKLMRETRGLLKREEHPLYIIANLQILKIHNGRVEPNSLCGDKAYIRWKVWKRWFDKKQSEVQDNTVISPKIVKELDCTKKFLFEKSDGEPTFEKMQVFFEKKMKVWVGTGKVSLYYVVLSPWLAKIGQDLEKKFSFDSLLYLEKVDEAVKGFFRLEFEHEFG